MHVTSLPLLPISLHQVPLGLRQALAQEGIPCQDLRGRPPTRFVLFDSRRTTRPSLKPGQHAIDVQTLCDADGEDPSDLLVDERSAPACWQIGEADAVEEIARVDKRAVRRRVMHRLRHEIERAGGMWLKLAAFPFPYRSALNFRIDYDEFDADDFAATLQAIRGWEDATSHFVCSGSYEDQPAALAQLRGLNVGSHGYRHHTYRHAADNLDNIRRGVDVLRRAGIEPSGFVAPHGRFNRGLLAALEQRGIGHSSEFALAYDDLPFWPGGGRVLQIPVHPVSLGIILEAGRNDRAVDTAVEHFVATAQAKYAAGEPVFFYGHPTRRLGRYPHVLRSVFATAAGFGSIWKTTYTAFADWWRQRSATSLRVYRQGDGYVVLARRVPREYLLAVEFWNEDRVAVMSVEGPVVRFSPEALCYEHRRALPQTTPQPVGRLSLGQALLRSLDWERVTPASEIRVRNWRGLVKKTLRYVKQ